MEEIASFSFHFFVTVACGLLAVGLLLAFTEFVVKTVKDIVWHWRGGR